MATLHPYVYQFNISIYSELIIQTNVKTLDTFDPCKSKLVCLKLCSQQWFGQVYNQHPHSTHQECPPTGPTCVRGRWKYKE